MSGVWWGGLAITVIVASYLIGEVCREECLESLGGEEEGRGGGSSSSIIKYLWWDLLPGGGARCSAVYSILKQITT